MFNKKHFYPDDAGSIQIYIGSMNTKIPNDMMKDLKMRFTKSAYDGDKDIVQVLAPFVGNPNAIITINNISSITLHFLGGKTPIECAIMNRHTEIIRFFAPLCDDYIMRRTVLGNFTLIHHVVLLGNAEAIEIIAPFMKNPNAEDEHFGCTPLELAWELNRVLGDRGENQDVNRTLQKFQ